MTLEKEQENTFQLSQRSSSVVTDHRLGNCCTRSRYKLQDHQPLSCRKMSETKDITMTTTINITYSSSTVSEEERLEYIQQLQHKTRITMTPAIILVVTISIVGVIGNSLVLYVYSRKFQQNPCRIFIMVIAILDLITNVVAIPGELYIMLHAWDFDNPALCQARMFMNAFIVFSEGGALIAVAVVRYRKVCNPHGWQITNKQAKRISVVIFLVGALFSVPYAITNGRHTIELSLPDINVYQCAVDDNYKNTIWPVLNNGFFLLLFTVSFLALLILYQRIIVTVWKQRKLFKKFIASSETAAHSNYNHEGVLHPVCATTEADIQNVQLGPENLQKDAAATDIFSNRKWQCIRASDDSSIRNHNETMKNIPVTRALVGLDDLECRNDKNDGTVRHIQLQDRTRTESRLSCNISGHLCKVTVVELENDLLPIRHIVNVETDARFVSDNCVGANEAQLINQLPNIDQTPTATNMKLQPNCEFADNFNRIPEIEITHNSVCHTETQNVNIVKHCVSGDFVNVYNEVCETDEDHDIDLFVTLSNNTVLKSLETCTFAEAFQEARKADVQDGSNQFLKEEMRVTGHSLDSFDQTSEAPNYSVSPCNNKSSNTTSFDAGGNVDVNNAAFDTHTQNHRLCEIQIQTGAKITPNLTGEIVDSLKKLSEIRLAYDESCNVLTQDQTNGAQGVSQEFNGHLSELSETELTSDSSCNSQIQRLTYRASRPICTFSGYTNDAVVTQIKDGLHVKNEGTSEHKQENNSLNVKQEETSKHDPENKDGCQANKPGRCKTIVSRADIARVKARTHPGVQHTRPMHVNRTTATVIAITAIYCLGFLPYILLSFFLFLAPDYYRRMSLTEESICEFFYRVILINCAANPVVYSLLGSNFRQACRELFRFRSK